MEYRKLGRGNKFLDERIGERDATMSYDEKMAKRFALERQVNNLLYMHDKIGFPVVYHVLSSSSSKLLCYCFLSAVFDAWLQHHLGLTCLSCIQLDNLLLVTYCLLAFFLCSCLYVH
jgi:hypothetical protein